MAGQGDDAAAIGAGEVAVGIGGEMFEIDSVAGAMQDDGGDGDLRLGGKLLLDRLQGRIAWRVPETVAIGMDHDLDEVRIVEGCRRPIESGIVEAPVRRPDR